MNRQPNTDLKWAQWFLMLSHSCELLTEWGNGLSECHCHCTNRYPAHSFATLSPSTSKLLQHLALVQPPDKRHHVITNWLEPRTAAKKPAISREQCPFSDYALGETQKSRVHVLSMIARRLPTQWEERYGIRPVLLETFVDTERFAGACYKAANWIYVGKTKGRGKFWGLLANRAYPSRTYGFIRSVVSLEAT